MIQNDIDNGMVLFETILEQISTMTQKKSTPHHLRDSKQKPAQHFHVMIYNKCSSNPTNRLSSLFWHSPEVHDSDQQELEAMFKLMEQIKLITYNTLSTPGDICAFETTNLSAGSRKIVIHCMNCCIEKQLSDIAGEVCAKVSKPEFEFYSKFQKLLKQKLTT